MLAAVRSGITIHIGIRHHGMISPSWPKNHRSDVTCWNEILNSQGFKRKNGHSDGILIAIVSAISRIGQYIAPSMCFFCSSVFQIQCWCERESKTASFWNDSTTLHLAPKRNQFMCTDSLWQTPCSVSFDVCCQFCPRWVLPNRVSKCPREGLLHFATIQQSRFLCWEWWRALAKKSVSCPSRNAIGGRDSKAPRSGKSKEHLRNLHLNAQEAWNLLKNSMGGLGGRWLQGLLLKCWFSEDLHNGLQIMCLFMNEWFSPGWSKKYFSCLHLP